MAKKYLVYIPLGYCTDLDDADNLIFGLSSLNADGIKLAYEKAKALTKCNFEVEVSGNQQYFDDEELSEDIQDEYCNGILLATMQKLTPFIIVEKIIKSNEFTGIGYMSISRSEFIKLLVEFIKIGNPSFTFTYCSVNPALPDLFSDTEVTGD